MLDRSDRLKEDEAAIRALVSDRWEWLVASADLLRNLLRVRVEDGNDLQMAATTVELLHDFFSRMVRYSLETGEDQYALYQRLVTL